MTKTPALALIATLSLGALGLCGCEEPSDCPAPTAEPAKTAAAAVSPAPAGSDAAAKPAPTPARTVAKAPTAAKPAPIVAPEEREYDVDLDADLYVKRLVIAQGVKDREPVDAASTFAQGRVKRIYAFVEVGNRDLSASEVYVSFRPKGGKERGRVRLRVGASPRWRTWAYTTQATEVGEWEAVVRNGRDEIIGTTSFEISDDPYLES